MGRVLSAGRLQVKSDVFSTSHSDGVEGEEQMRKSTDAYLAEEFFSRFSFPSARRQRRRRQISRDKKSSLVTLGVYFPYLLSVYSCGRAEKKSDQMKEVESRAATAVESLRTCELAGSHDAAMTWARQTHRQTTGRSVCRRMASQHPEPEELMGNPSWVDRKRKKPRLAPTPPASESRASEVKRRRRRRSKRSVMAAKVVRGGR